MWYLAKVTAVDSTKSFYSLEYLDDGNTEDNVARDEIRGILKRLEKSAADSHPLGFGLAEDNDEQGKSLASVKASNTTAKVRTGCRCAITVTSCSCTELACNAADTCTGYAGGIQEGQAWS